MPIYRYPVATDWRVNTVNEYEADSVWTTWTGTGTSTASTINYDQVWYSWTNTSATGGGIRIETDEDRLRRRQRFVDENHAIADEQQARRFAVAWAHDNLPADQRQAYIDATTQERQRIRDAFRREQRRNAWVRRALREWFQGENFAEARQAFIDAPYEEKAPLLDAHKRELDRLRAERRRQAQERARNAESRAVDLLKMVIPAEEFRRWRRDGEIRVTGSEGGVYVIRCNTHEGNVDYYQDGIRQGSFCAHPRMGFSNGNRLPLPDAIAAQYLALVHDEWQFIATANTYNIWGDPDVMAARKRLAHNAITARRGTEAQRDAQALRRDLANMVAA